MAEKNKIFIASFILSLPFWWGVNLLEKNTNELFFLKEISKNPQIFAAQIAPALKPSRLKAVEDPDIAAKSAIVIFIDKEGKKQILFEKNSEEILPIASLTKLMTALIVLKNYDLSKEIKISKEAVDQEETFGKLREGEIFKTGYLLYPLLMESSNDAAFALANDYEGIEEEKFIEMMNEKAQTLGLTNTRFYNSSGLEPDAKNAEINHSTAGNMAELTRQLLKMPKIWEILSTAEYNLYGPTLKNTNELLSDQSVKWKSEILGGKTGYAEKAGGCMILAVKAPKDRGFIITVALGTANSNAKFIEIKKLVDWVRYAYRW